MRAYNIAFVGACTCMVLCGACASPAVSPITYSVRQVPQGDRAALLATAQSALVDLGYAIDEVDEREGLVTARPTAPEKHDEVMTGRDRLTLRGEMRRVAQVRVGTSEGGVRIFCRVAVQRQTTEAYRMFDRDRRVSDVPSDTPVERDAATTPEQNTVWETVRRDMTAERLILQNILQRTGTTSE